MQSEPRSNSRMFGEVLRSLLRDGISVRFHASGRSMYPAIGDGDHVQVDPSSQTKRGDVVMVETPEGLRVHRVVASGNAIRTRGDCCVDYDSVAGVLGSVRVVNGNATGFADRQKFGSVVRRWVARWRGHF